MSDGSGTEFGSGKLGHRPSNVGGIYSDDGGQTWRPTDVVARDHQNVPYGSAGAAIINPSETLAVELSDGRILFNIRSESSPHKRLVSISPNGATNWSIPQFDDALLDPVRMAGILRLDDSGSVLFTNPDNLEHDMAWGSKVNCDRKRLSAKLSVNDCSAWIINRVIEEGPSGYCDLALLEDGMILCFYGCGQVSRMADDKYCMLARFDREWVEGGDRL
jgi:sialidase-1